MRYKARFLFFLSFVFTPLSRWIAVLFFGNCGYISILSFLTSILDSILVFKSLKYEVEQSFGGLNRISSTADNQKIRMRVAFDFITVCGYKLLKRFGKVFLNIVKVFKHQITMEESITKAEKRSLISKGKCHVCGKWSGSRAECSPIEIDSAVHITLVEFLELPALFLSEKRVKSRKFGSNPSRFTMFLKMDKQLRSDIAHLKKEHKSTSHLETLPSGKYQNFDKQISEASNNILLECL